MITIRELKSEDDLPGILSLCKDFFTEYESYHGEFFDLDNLTDEDLSGRFVESIESNNSATFVALVDNVIVGYAAVDVRDQPDFYKVKKVGAIWGLMVDKNHRRRGIASHLLEKARGYFQQKGIKYFTLYTAVANKGAIEFYKNNGLNPLHMAFIGENENEKTDK